MLQLSSFAGRTEQFLVNILQCVRNVVSGVLESGAFGDAGRTPGRFPKLYGFLGFI